MSSVYGDFAMVMGLMLIIRWCCWCICITELVWCWRCRMCVVMLQKLQCYCYKQVVPWRWCYCAYLGVFPLFFLAKGEDIIGIRIHTRLVLFSLFFQETQGIYTLPSILLSIDCWQHGARPGRLLQLLSHTLLCTLLSAIQGIFLYSYCDRWLFFFYYQ